MTSVTSVEVRDHIVQTLRRDLIGPGPDDVDLQRERLDDKPSGWYVTGFLAPLPAQGRDTQEEPEEEGDPYFGDDMGGDAETGPARAADDRPEDDPPAAPIRAPSSLGLTVLLDASVTEVAVKLSWGDYVTVPPLSPEKLLDEKADAPEVVWDRIPGEYNPQHSRAHERPTEQDPSVMLRRRATPVRCSPDRGACSSL